MGLHELSDGGIGRKALSAHTKNEDNRRQFFQLYRRMARQVPDQFTHREPRESGSACLLIAAPHARPSALNVAVP